MSALGSRAFFVLSLCSLLTPAFSAAAQKIDPAAAEALLRAGLSEAICVKADGKPLAGDIVGRLRASGIKLTDGDKPDCAAVVYLGHFSSRPDLGTYEMQFSSQMFGGNNVAVLKRFPDGWHVISTYHIGVWL